MPRTRSPTGPAGALPPQSAAPDPVLSPPQLQISTRSFGIDGSRTRAVASSDAQQLAGSPKLERVGQNKNRSKLLESVMLDAPVYDLFQQLPEQTLRERDAAEPYTKASPSDPHALPGLEASMLFERTLGSEQGRMREHLGTTRRQYHMS